MKPELPSALESPTGRLHARRLVDSYYRWTGQHLVPPDIAADQPAESLFYADFAIVSHGTGDDPVFNFGNAIALGLFEMDWADFTSLASHRSAEPEARRERASLMARVSQEGFVSGYRGVRVSASGKRFMIADATVWEVLDSEGGNHGRAARFDRWWPLPQL